MAFVRTWLWRGQWQNHNILKCFENSHAPQKSLKLSNPMIPLVKSRPTRLHACSFWRWYPLLCRKSPSSDWYLDKTLFTLDIRECAADLWHTSGEDISYCAICLFPSPCTWQVDNLKKSESRIYKTKLNRNISCRLFQVREVCGRYIAPFIWHVHAFNKLDSTLIVSRKS